jgi:hypothetical protein
MAYPEKLMGHLKTIGDILLDKTNAKTFGKKWKGEVNITVHIYEGGITGIECEIVEKFKNM